MEFPSSTLRRFVAGFAALALMPLAASGEIAAPVGAGPKSRGAPAQGERSGQVPKPRGGTAEVERGGEVQIPLGIYGSSIEQLSFIVREAPAAGLLSEIGELDRATGVVTYTHSGEPSGTRDRFTFAARNRSGVSAPATVEIRIVDPPALLVVPDRVDFGGTTTGTEPATRVLTLQNRGRGVARGVVSTTAPWSIGEDARYVVEPGDESSITIIFRPERTGAQRGFLRFSSDPARSTELRGEGLPPFSAGAETLALDPVSRSGDLPIVNLTDLPLEIAAHADKRLGVANTLTLAPNENVLLRVKVAPGSPEAFRAELELEGGGHKVTVSVEAPAAPAALAVEPEALAEFEPDLAQELVVTNTGGSPVQARIEAPAGLVLKPARIALAPGRGERVAVTATTHAPARGQIVLSWPEGSVEIPFTVKLPAATPVPAPTAEPARPARRPSLIAPRPAPEPPAAAGPEDYMELTDPAQERAASLPAIGQAVISGVTRRTAALSWPARPELRYRIEQRHLGARDGKLIVLWEAADEDRPVIADGRGKVEFTGLTPAASYTVRVYGENDAGEFTPPSPAITFQTHPGVSLRPSLLTTLLFILAGAIVVLVVRKRRQQQGPAGD